MKKIKSDQKKKCKISGTAIAFLIIVLLALVWICMHAFMKDTDTVGREEFEFYKELVERDLADGVTEEALEAAAKEKISRVHAEFALANQMGLYDGYSFKNLQKDMEMENKERKLKKERGEVFYGPVEFNLTTYFQYISSNLKLDMVSYLTENADAKILEDAERYFEEHAENYLLVEKIDYLLTEDGSEKEVSLLREDMSTLEKTDSMLFEFLYYGAVGDTMEYSYAQKERTVQIISVEYEELTFKNHMERVVRDYITNVYLEELILKQQEEDPVEFKLS